MFTNLPAEVIEQLIEVLQSCSRVESAVIYGSYAKGTATPRSDIDLAIKGGKLERFDISALAMAFDESNIIQQVDLQNYHEIRNTALKEHIDRVGIEVYSRP
jgi:predicted nucleotidyltransferase